MTFDVILKNGKGQWVAACVDISAKAAIKQAGFWVKESKELNNEYKVHFQIH